MSSAVPWVLIIIGLILFGGLGGWYLGGPVAGGGVGGLGLLILFVFVFGRGSKTRL